MGIAVQTSHDRQLDWTAALAALAWQVDLGVSEVVQEAPQNSFDLPEAAPWTRRASDPATPRAEGATPPPQVSTDPVAAARAAAGACATLADLRDALTAFDLCEVKRGARNTVFADGNPAARVLILTQAPGRDEDLEGRPLVGREGLLLDRMFAAIGLSRSNPDPARAIYVTPVMPWRPPGNRDPDPAELAMMRPFVDRHIALVDPDLIVTLGNSPLLALTGGLTGWLAARGSWGQVLGKPLMPMVHPSYLLRNPLAKREVWADLLQIKARLT